MAAAALRAQVLRAPRRLFASAAHSGAKGGATPTALAAEIAEEHHAAGTKGLWRNISFYLAFPAIGLSAAATFYQMSHHSHASHDEPVRFGTYQRIRAKPFPWGDGDHSLFHNPHINH